MFDLIVTHQLNLMLALSGACGICAIFVLISKTLSAPKKKSLFLIEICSMCLLLVDIGATIYDGDPSVTGYWMVRICTFFVFLMTISVVYFFNLYLKDIVTDNTEILVSPKRLMFAACLYFMGIIMIVISQFTDLYYSFDASNMYHRSSGYFISYIVPFVAPVIQLSFVVQYYKKLHVGIRHSLLLFPVVPIISSIVQVFFYGINLIDMSIACVAILLYMFALLDVNTTLTETHKIEMELIKKEEKEVYSLFGQIVTAFVSAIDAKDENTKGHATRVADYAKKISEISGKSEEECEAAYFSALLHDVGKIAIPDKLIKKREDLTEDESVIFDEHATRGKEILEQITEFPYLQDGAASHHEWYDGSGFPDKLSGDQIPELARIVAVADVYDDMSSIKKDREPLPQQLIREEVLKMTGKRLDPKYTKALIEMIDGDTDYMLREHHESETNELESEISCKEYRSRYTKGILIDEEVRKITFRYEDTRKEDGEFSAPAIILFGSLDGRVHTTDRSIAINNYSEYGEAWFDGHVISTRARNMKLETLGDESTDGTDKSTPGLYTDVWSAMLADVAPEDGEYLIEAARVKDHMRLRMMCGEKQSDLIVSLPDSSGSAFISITGEHCHISEITTDTVGVTMREGDIPRISDEITYIDRMVGDVPNIQIDSYLSAATDGVSITDGMEIKFHTMTLPAANLVWNCPFLVFFKSDDNTINGPNYEELAIVRLDGEVIESGGAARSDTETKRDDSFESWDKWKEINKKGYECHVDIRRKHNRIIMHTVNGGIDVKSIIYTLDKEEDIRVAITGDQCALTDIRFIA